MDDKGGGGGGGGGVVSVDEDYQPSLRVCTVTRPQEGSCGFHLSRTTWDPYPWISEVESGSAAELAGLQVGDCVLEVNGDDVLGQRIGEVALRVYSRGRHVKLLLWNAGADSNGTIWLSGGSGPTPLSLQRLAVCLQSVVQLLECPVCLETSPPPAFQCCNGHLLCGDCRAHADRCPICRVQLGSRGRCLLADKLYALLTSTFLRECHPKKRKGVFRSKGVPRLKLKSRLPKQPGEGEGDEETVRITEIPVIKSRLIASLSSSGGAGREPSYCCPTGECDRQLFAADDLLRHIQTAHEGPLVQYFPKTSTASLRLPISHLTVIDCHRLQFYVHVVPHKAVGCLMLWLWAVADPAVAGLYRFRLHHPALKAPAHGPVLPLTMSEADVMRSAEHCLVLDNFDIGPTNRVDITISLKDESGGGDLGVEKVEQ